MLFVPFETVGLYFLESRVCWSVFLKNENIVRIQEMLGKFKEKGVKHEIAAKEDIKEEDRRIN